MPKTLKLSDKDIKTILAALYSAEQYEQGLIWAHEGLKGKSDFDVVAHSEDLIARFQAFRKRLTGQSKPPDSTSDAKSYTLTELRAGLPPGNRPFKAPGI